MKHLLGIGPLTLRAGMHRHIGNRRPIASVELHTRERSAPDGGGSAARQDGAMNGYDEHA
jgi:hypothetical protein